MTCPAIRDGLRARAGPGAGVRLAARSLCANDLHVWRTGEGIGFEEAG